VSQEEFITGFGRIRDAVIGPDGWLYFTTSNRDGRGSPAADDDKIVRIRIG
jgi:glucose/arabinose dehydrogenase